MSKQKMPWLEKHLRLITLGDINALGDDAQKIFDEGEGKFAEIHPWSLLKLVSLKNLKTVYARIIKKYIEKGYFKKMYYVDLFSGPGINKVKSSPTLCFGSPLIVNGLERKRQFTKMFLNDEEESNVKALDSRLNCVAQTEYIVTKEDANLCIEKILPEISEERCHSLIFIDPYSTEFSWRSMETILGINADIFFLYQTSQMPRGISVVASADARIKCFFKDWKNVLETYENELILDKPPAIFEMYKEDVRDTRGPKTLMESIRINGGNFYYDMLFVTKKTRGENPWFKAVTSLKNRIESYDSESVENTLDIILGKQSQLTRWDGRKQSTLFFS